MNPTGKSLSIEASATIARHRNTRSIFRCRGATENRHLIIHAGRYFTAVTCPMCWFPLEDDCKEKVILHELTPEQSVQWVFHHAEEDYKLRMGSQKSLATWLRAIMKSRDSTVSRPRAQAKAPVRHVGNGALATAA